MIQILVYLIGLFFIFNIIKDNSYKRIVWFFLGLLLIPPGLKFLDKPFNWFIILALLISLIIRNDLQKIKKIPLKKVFLFFFICMMCIGLFDNRISISQKITRPFFYFYENILPGILVYASLTGLKDYRKLHLSLIYIMAFFSIYGIFCFVTQTNPYITGLSSEFSIRDISFEFLNGADGRVRTSSFLFHPYLYGILLLFISLISLYFYQYGVEKRSNKKILFITLSLLILNIIMTNSRTVFIVFVALFGLYVLLQTTFKNIFLIISGILIVYISILFVPALKEKTDLIMDVFESGGKKVEGSSVEMREVQLLVSYAYFLQKPITGNGFNFIYEGLGFRTDISERESSSELYAFESYFYILLIEQGVLGIVSNLLLFIALVYYNIKNYFKVKLLKHKRYILLNSLIVVGYLIYILATGTINSFPFFLFFVGISLSVQQKLTSNNLSLIQKSKII